MAKKIVIIDVEESLEDKVKKYKARFHIMTFVSLFLILGFIINETKSTEKLSQEMNKHRYSYDYDEILEETEEDNLNLDILSNMPVVKSNVTSNVKSNTKSNKTSTKKVEDAVSQIKSNLTVEKIVTPTKSKTKTTTTTTTEVKNAIEEKEVVSSFENDSWDEIVNNIKNNKINYKVGDTKNIELTIDGEKNTYKIKIANIESNNIIIEFVDILYIDVVEEYPTIWSNSNTRNYLNSTLYESLPNSIKNNIINNKTIINNNGEESTIEDNIYISNINEIVSYDDYKDGNKIGVNPIFRLG